MNEKLDLDLGAAEMAEFKQRAEILGQHFTPAEREQMRERAEQLGEAGVQQAHNEWPQLIKEVRASVNLGIPATDPAVQALGRRWHALVNAFTGGDANIARKLEDAYDKEPQVMAAQGMDPAMFTYIRAAMQAAGLKLQG